MLAQETTVSLGFPILTAIILVPIIGALLVALSPRSRPDLSWIRPHSAPIRSWLIAHCLCHFSSRRSSLHGASIRWASLGSASLGSAAIRKARSHRLLRPLASEPLPHEGDRNQ